MRPIRRNLEIERTRSVRSSADPMSIPDGGAVVVPPPPSLDVQRLSTPQDQILKRL